MSEELPEDDYDAMALIIQPEEVFTPHICCDNCGLEYSKEDYAILFENKKLVFVHTSDNVAEKKDIDFRIDYILCQQCVFTLSKIYTQIDHQKFSSLTQKRTRATLAPLIPTI